MADDESKFRPKGLTYRVHLAGAEARLPEAILYVADACKDAPRFGLIKLNKIIWRADFTAFAARKVPVTGVAYQKLEHGPAPVEMRPVLREMEQSNQIEIERIDLGDGKVEQRVMAVLPPHSRFFSPSDCDFLDAAIQYYWDRSGMEASRDSHGVAWATRDIGDEMPYELAYLSDEKLADGSLERFVKKAEAGRWTSA